MIHNSTLLSLRPVTVGSEVREVKAVKEEVSLSEAKKKELEAKDSSGLRRFFRFLSTNAPSNPTSNHSQTIVYIIKDGENYIERYNPSV